MYVDANSDSGCTELVFQLNGASTKEWKIKVHSYVNTGKLFFKKNLLQVTQYSCDYNNLPPSGCTQYFYGSNTGNVQTFNYDSQHLANQNQVICVR